MSSLQDQLLKSGLVSKDKATKAKSAKRKQAKINRKHKIETIDENKQAAEKQMVEQAEKARNLNQEKNAKAEAVAIQAQIKQLIQVNQQNTGKPSVIFNFTDENKIKKIEVSEEIHKHISYGLLAIARFNNGFALVPKMVALKIQQRSDDIIIPLNYEEPEIEEDDPYSEYEIPDDLIW